MKTTSEIIIILLSFISSALQLRAGVADPMVIATLSGPTNSYFAYPHANGFWRSSTTLGRSTFVYVQGAVSPSGSGLTAGGNLYEFDPDATNTIFLGKMPTMYEGYDIARNGTLIAVTRGKSLSGVKNSVVQVAKMDLNTGLSTMLYYPNLSGGMTASVGCSPDGKQAVINTLTDSAGNSEVQTIDTTSTTVTTLVSKNWQVNHAHFSPYDSDWVPFCHEGYPVTDRMWAWNAESAPSGMNLFSSASFVVVHERAMFHKAGMVTVMDYNSSGNPKGVYEVDFDKSYRCIVTNSTVYHVNISRDGRWGVFELQPTTTNQWGLSSIVIFNFATGATKTLFNNVGTAYLPYQPDPHISPDGNWIIFNETNQWRWVAIKLDQTLLRSFLGGGGSVPGAPAGLTAATVSSSEATLGWTASSNFPSYYNIKRSTNSGGPYTTFVSGVTPINYSDTTIYYTDTNLSPNTTYYYVVSAANTGGEGSNSPQASATTEPLLAPVTPTNLVATAGNGVVTLSWNASSVANSYNIKRAIASGGPYTTIASGVTNINYMNTGLGNGTTYYYVVSATNTVGESQDSALVGATPSATILIQDSFTTNSAAVTARVPEEATIAGRSYQISQAGNQYGNYVSNGVANLTCNIAELIGITNGGSYTKPTNLTITATFDEGFLTGDGNSGRGVYAGFWSSIGSSAESEENMRGIFINPENGNLVLWNGGRYASSGGVQTNTYKGTWSRARMRHTMSYTINTVSGGIRNFVLDGVPYDWNPTTIFSSANTTYAGIGVTGTTAGDCGYIDSWTLQDASFNPPTGVIATTISGSQIDLSWSAAAGATSYTVKRATISGGPYTTIASGVTSTNYSDTNLLDGTAYYYVVCAVAGSNESINSAEAPASQTDTTIVRDEFQADSALVTGRAPENNTIQGRVYQVSRSDNQYTNYVTAGSAWLTCNIGEMIAITNGDGFVKPTNLTITVSFWENTLENNPVYQARGVYAGFWSSIPSSGDSYGNMRGVFVNPNDGRLILWNGDSNPSHAGVQTNNYSGTWTGGGTKHTMSYTVNTVSGNITNFVLDGVSYNWKATEIFNDANTAYAGIGVSGSGTSDVGWIANWNLVDSTLRPPVDLTAFPGNTRVTLNWAASSGVAGSYTVKRATVSGGPYSNIATGVTSTNYTDDGLANDTSYYYVVSATNSLGSSGNSSEVDATPSAAILVQDTFTTNSTHITGRVPQEATILNRAYQICVITNNDYGYSNSVNSGVATMAVNLAELIAITNGTGYTKPTNLTISVRFNEGTLSQNSPTRYPGRGVYAGFWNSIPMSDDAEGNMRGVFVNPDNGNLVLWDGDNSPWHAGVQTLAYKGTWSGGSTWHTMSYVVDTTSGNITNLVLDGISYTWSPTTIFSGANTVYAGVGVSGASTVNNYGYIDNWSLEDASIISPPGGMEAAAILKNAGDGPIVFSRPFNLSATSKEHSFVLTFSGALDTMYSVWGSTNLVDWELLGAATEVSRGQYQFADTTRTNYQQRFYRISAP